MGITIDEGFTVEIGCDYADFWKYNVAVTCGCFEGGGDPDRDTRTDFVAAEDTVAPAGSNLAARPDNCPEHRGVSFTTVPCDYLLMYVYIIPHTLPAVRNIDDCRPFGLDIRVRRGNATIYDRRHSINCWAGASIELRIPELKQS